MSSNCMGLNTYQTHTASEVQASVTQIEIEGLSGDMSRHVKGRPNWKNIAEAHGKTNCQCHRNRIKHIEIKKKICLTGVTSN